MDFFESIFSIIPLLMIVLFFVRLAAVSKKKNRPKPLNTIPPAKNTEIGIEPLPADSKKSEQRNYPSGPQALNALHKKRNDKPPEKDILGENISRERLNNLSELKKAVIWSEILGKPKGLD